MGDVRRGAWGPLRDVVGEGVGGVTRRGSRAWLTAAGIAAGVASLVAVVGLTQTSTERLLRRLDTLTPTLVTATPVGTGAGDGPAITWHVERQLGRLDGVVAAGAIGTVRDRPISIEGRRLLDPAQPEGPRLDVVLATSRAVETLGGRIAEGRFFDALHDAEPHPVVVLGPAAARSLQSPPVDGYASVLIDDAPHVVLGVLADERATAQLAGAVLLPSSRAEELGAGGPEVVYVRARPGHTEAIAEHLPEVLHPGAPRDVAALAARPDPEVAAVVESETNSLFVLLSLVAVALATLTVSVVMLMTVLERRTEIGLRRAIGATRLRVAGEFLVHSTWLGAVGGIGGTAAGALVTAAVALLAATVPVVDVRIVLAGPLIGTGAGLLAGVYPATRAARVPPAQALRSM